MNPQDNTNAQAQQNDANDYVEPGTPIDYEEMWELLDNFPEQTEEDKEREFWFGYGKGSRL